jgi:hypothetical protein
MNNDNRDKSESSNINKEDYHSSQSTTVNTTDLKVLAKTIASDFWAAIKSRDVNKIMAISSVPFYY